MDRASHYECEGYKFESYQVNKNRAIIQLVELSIWSGGVGRSSRPRSTKKTFFETYF